MKDSNILLFSGHVICNRHKTEVMFVGFGAADTELVSFKLLEGFAKLVKCQANNLVRMLIQIFDSSISYINMWRHLKIHWIYRV